MKYLTLDDVIDLIRDGVAMVGSQKDYADFAGVPQADISNTLHGHRRPSKRLLKYLGLQAVKVYQGETK